MFFTFRRLRAMDPLQVAMTGVRMGERYLQIFCSDAALTGGLATKTGLSGVAALAAPDEDQAARARAAASKAGVLIDVQVTPPMTLPWQKAAFDMVVIDDTAGGFASLDGRDRAATLRAVRDVLRPGGRLEIIERIGRRATPPGEYVQEGGAEGVLRAAHFKPVRTLVEKDGFRFVEGLNTGPV
jgi:SAM-dependent methyltransferase